VITPDQRVLTGCCILLLVTACAARPAANVPVSGPGVQIAGIEIHNALSAVVQDVTILVPATGEYVSCGQILPESSCSTTFPLRDYRESAVQVSWKEEGKPHSTPAFKLEAPATAIDGQRAYIRVEVFASGQAGAKLILLDDEPH
jgi:hypothetical protein